MLSHVIPQCLVTDRITIKLQLTAKSCLTFKLSLNLRKHCLLSEQLSRAMKQTGDYTLQSNGKHLHVLRVKHHTWLCAKAFLASPGVGSYHSSRPIRHYESLVFCSPKSAQPRGRSDAARYLTEYYIPQRRSPTSLKATCDIAYLYSTTCIHCLLVLPLLVPCQNYIKNTADSSLKASDSRRN